MPSKKITVQIMSPGILEDDIVVLGDMLIKQWKIPTHLPLLLTFGSFRQRVKVIPLSRSDGVRISSGLARKMGIQPRSPLRLIYRPHSSTLQLGPLLGILLSQDFPGNPERPFGQMTLFCKELVNACSRQGVFVYFFTPRHIGSSASQVTGWVYGNGWKQTQLPAADVFYNRLNSRKLENKPSVQHFMKEVKSRYGSHFFNEKYLDKTEVFDALGRDVTVQRYLPESHLFRNYAMLKAMCAKYPVVFLKPIKGSLGKGIIRISRLEGGAFQTLTAQVGGTRRQAYPNLAKLFTALSGKMKATRYQIQQGLHLIEVDHRPVDFRALVQKNIYGKWNTTSIVARIAGNQHFVSNLARGGTLSTVKDALARSSLPSGIKSKLALKLKKAALDIAQSVDAQIPAHFGEFGIDLAVETSGRVWLLEVNSKPSKNDNTPMGEGKIRPSVKQVIEYTRYLSGF
ncbi:MULTISPECIES: YheC/YheD family endospore coat-associated protein [Paenibacillus]|jgi:glutathione synthase/RimK-type ligase-like ATP-grasp enzyme|uniref:YheC/YheD family endospore coat-associated protein n=1 Tax=Paenibacillus TaxID=44249 RepID=UPI00073E9B47|nr:MULTISPECIES: YheC/YheD family protein [Paenibacillus]MDU4696438.1 YheC/YheD family protein [Paenibacillus sp.]